MPATEQTWYNQKVLHIVFGFSGLALLLSTLWMFAADHNREWKGYQRRFREAEQRLTTWRKAEAQSLEQQTELASLERQLTAAQSEPPPKELYGNFKNEVLKDLFAREKLEEAELKEEVGHVVTWFNAEHSADQAFAGRFASMDGDYHALNQSLNGVVAERENVTGSQKAVQEASAALAAALEQSKAAASGDAAAKEAAQSAFDAAEKALDDAESGLASASETLVDVEGDVAKERNAFVADLTSVLDKAVFREKQLLSRKKFRSADRDAANAQLDIGVRDEVSEERLAELQEVVDRIVVHDDITGKLSVNELSLAAQDATAHREKLQSMIGGMTLTDSELKKQIANNMADIDRLDTTFKERRSTWFVGAPPFLGKRWLELPIVSAFGTPLKIDNKWVENLTRQNGSFGQVRRFDRCTTCHQGIAKTAPGSAVDPAYQPEQQFEIVLQTPDAEPQPTTDADGNEVPATLKSVYGLELASFGLIDDNAVTVNQIVPNSAAASAAATSDAHGNTINTGLEVGDVILSVDGDKPLNPGDAEQFLLSRSDWSRPATLTVLRGLPQPFTSHPRLDLFMGPLSPHTEARFACTSCHDGQGSATDFKWASHAPNSVEQEHDWATDHGYFHNHHWIFPMYPKRFAESSCLKCHHEVAELEPSVRFPDAPAPKVVEGWHLIGQYGCFGCHEVNGYDGEDRIGPDVRLEPNYFAAAAAVKNDPAFEGLDDDVKDMATTLVQRPYRDDMRQELRQYLLDDQAAEKPVLTSYTHKMASVLQDQASPGERRKAGPSLRHVATKLGEPFLYDWIREPKNFRPSSKMPQFFGLWDHLDGDDKQLAVDYERVEILGMVKYLTNYSQPMEYLDPEKGCEPGDAARGKIAFEVRGCIACHQHEDFAHVTSKQGPNLTNLGDKFAAGVGTPAAKLWLYTWVKRPTHYHARTKMPDLYLDPVKTVDGKIVDPVADMVEYLLSSKRGWQPAKESTDSLSPNNEKLNALVAEHLTSTFPQRRALKYLDEGIPDEVASTLKGAEVELVGQMSDEKKLLYVGRKAISKYGCYGCHDIPGFEGAKPIGAALAEWGRKESSKLAFEHIAEYLHHGHGAHGGHGSHGAHGGGEDAAHGHGTEAGHGHADGEHAEHDDHGMAHHAEDPEDVAFFEGQIGHHDRMGFLWQKLREPRSYDYKKTANKKYNDRLRMPLFPINPEEREAIMTFVLGLVSDPPADEFIYHSEPKQLAVVEGKRVLEKYNCGGCHILEAEKWEIESAPGEIAYQVADSFIPPPFATAHFSADDLAKSKAPDARRGLIKSVLSGMPSLDNAGNVLAYDEDGDPVDFDDPEALPAVEYQLQLWEPAAYDGQVANIGGKLMVPISKVTRKWPATGGDLTRWLLPRVTELEKLENPQANGNESWGWLPPPLLGEGKKVQPDWLHSFLLEPHPIRPATFLRMPKFNMSPEEATKLVKYFAGRDGEVFPFEFDDRMIANNLEQHQAEFAAKTGSNKSRMDHAMDIVTNGNYCIKCHLVGDYVPESNQRALAPDLAEVQNRLRPTYLRNWIAYPKHILPYTPMPINIQYDPNNKETLGGIDQGLYPGTSIEQIDGLVDLLMNFSTHVEGKYDFSGLVKQASQGAAGAPEAPADGGAGGESAEEEEDEPEQAQAEKEPKADEVAAGG